MIYTVIACWQAPGKRHETRVKLCPNNLEGAGGRYAARTGSGAALTRENILAAMRERGGFAGNTEDFLANPGRFFDETERHARDGFAASMETVAVCAKVNGPFDSAREPVTPETRPISFHARVTGELRKLIPYIDGAWRASPGAARTSSRSRMSPPGRRT
ncbi:MAG: hypothetical protein LBG27_04125 [Spirochaetaceae bacterium]|nr:hypothetical protein [Spirochaetaceae bacterium]